MDIKDSVVLITGANRGLGKALVQELIKAEVRKIYALSRDSSKITIVGGKTEIVPLQYDVTNLASLQKIALQANDVNILINNAGVLSTGDILDVSIDSIKHNFDTNFYGALALSRVLVPVIKANTSGAIVNILTLLSLASMPAFSAYNASKAAAWSMTLSLRASLTETNIDVHSVFPGAINTDMIDGIEIPKTSPEKVAQAIVKGIHEGEEDIFPDSMSKEVYAAWSTNHKTIEKQFAQM